MDIFVTQNTRPRVFVMLSGGVDSSVAAACLVEQGYDVIGVFMKCWSIEQLESLGASQDLYGCFWEEDSQDARMVASKLGIPFYVWDFQDIYKQKVVDYMLGEYRAGLTPNPDVMCNSVVKFGVFYERARQLGADFVATGHYARIIENTNNTHDVPGGTKQKRFIARGLDDKKDQSYFLWNIPADRLDHTLFPIGEFASKSEVRAKAEKLDLITASKPDSQGLCFIGETPLRELLLQVLGEKEGVIKDTHGMILGQHKGAYLFTIGQRFGLNLSGGPWFVVNIDVDNNIVTVTHDLEPEPLLRSEVTIKALNWLVDPLGLTFPLQCRSQVRYRQQDAECVVELQNDNSAKVRFSEPVRAVAKGQSLVLYLDSIMLGGGVLV